MVNDISELINRRRRQILIHSAIYYELNDNIIDDRTWSKWALELVDLQKKYPEIAEKCVYAEEFRDFDGSTGFHLPINSEEILNKATELLNTYKRTRG